MVPVIANCCIDLYTLTIGTDTHHSYAFSTSYIQTVFTTQTEGLFFMFLAVSDLFKEWRLQIFFDSKPLMARIQIIVCLWNHEIVKYQLNPKNELLSFICPIIICTNCLPRQRCNIYFRYGDWRIIFVQNSYTRLPQNQNLHVRLDTITKQRCSEKVV